MKIALTASAISVAFLSVVLAQTAAAPTFDVASIKPDNAGGNYIEVTPGTLNAHGATLATCITWAYGVQSNQVSGAESAVSRLLDSERYTITAKTAGLVPESQLKVMLQTLLAERFKLVLHRQSRQMQVYAMVVDRNGPTFHESKGDGESKQLGTKLTRRWTWTRMSQLADNMAEAMQAPVLDQTGLPGKYDVALDLTPYLPTAAPRPDLPTVAKRPDIGSMMVTALREQLGLKLESRRAAVDVLVIDHVEKPAAD